MAFVLTRAYLLTSWPPDAKSHATEPGEVKGASSATERRTMKGRRARGDNLLVFGCGCGRYPCTARAALQRTRRHPHPTHSHMYEQADRPMSRVKNPQHVVLFHVPPSLWPLLFFYIQRKKERKSNGRRRVTRSIRRCEECLVHRLCSFSTRGFVILLASSNC